MYDIHPNSNSSVSVNCNVMERKYELTYNVCYLSFIDEYKYEEVTAHNSGKANI